MSFQSWQETLIASSVDGPTLTAAARASAIPPAALITLPPNWWYVGRMMKVTAQGRISNVVTTPGTARWGIGYGAIDIWDGGAIALNQIAKVTIPFWLEIILTCRAVGVTTSANVVGFGTFMSEAVVGSVLPSAGGQGTMLMPVGVTTIPTASGGFDSTIANIQTLNFTQTVATGSMTVHQYKVEALN